MVGLNMKKRIILSGNLQMPMNGITKLLTPKRNENNS